VDQPPPILELRDASVVRGCVRVLDRLTLTIAAAEHVAIVGPNGAGKSSLIRLLTLEDYPLASTGEATPATGVHVGGGAASPGAASSCPASGRASGEPPMRLFGRARWDVAELRSRMGIVSAEVHDRFTEGPWAGQVPGLDVVLSGFFASRGVFRHHTITDEMRDRARQALVRTGALHLATARLDRLSTGEARRVLIARALVHAPAALVLDEPTTGLDVVARHRFMEHVRHIAQQGTTVLLVTQHIDEILPEIGRVIVLKEGRIIDDGPKDRVLRGHALEEAFGGPLRVACEEGYYYVRPGPV
jgi:iron complex transport system ATP-binding protein